MAKTRAQAKKRSKSHHPRKVEGCRHVSVDDHGEGHVFVSGVGRATFTWDRGLQADVPTFVCSTCGALTRLGRVESLKAVR